MATKPGEITRCQRYDFKPILPLTYKPLFVNFNQAKEGHSFIETLLILEIPCLVFSSIVRINSWLTVSNQIVKSLSLPNKKFYFFNKVQPIDLIFCKMVDIIE